MKITLSYILLSANLIFAQQDSVQHISNSGLEDLINSALKSNLRIEPVEYERKILLSKIDQVNKQSPPQLEVMVDYLPVNFESAGEYSLFYTQPVKLFGKLDAEESMARLTSRRPLIEKSELQNDLIRSVKENYFMLSENERMLEYIEEFKQILNGITKSIEIKYSVGKGNQFEIMKSNNEFQKLLLEEIDLSNNKKILINNLSTLSNLDLPAEFKTKNVDLLLNIDTPQMDTTYLDSIMTLNNTDLKYVELMKDENRIEKNLKDLERSPDFMFTGGYRYMTETKMNLLLFSAGIDLPFVPWNSRRIDSAIREKYLEEMKINSEARALMQNLNTELKNTITMINALSEKIRYISTVLIPQSEQTLKAALISYESAGSDFIELLDSYRTLRENSKMLLENETDYLIVISSLERLIGKQILTIN